MTKSQNTKNEQQKDLCITSEQLTEQWKKGELPEGYYYCKTENGAEILRTWRGIDGYLNFENMCNEVFISRMDDCEVLAEVPDYVEWRNMVNCACEEHEANKRFIEENEQLKELLKECKNILEEQTFYRNTCLETDGTLRNRIVKKAEILQKIDEVLRC